MEEIPGEFRCPLTFELMIDPVVCDDGYSYERESIIQWLKLNNNISPMTEEIINPSNIKSNYSLKGLIEKYKQTHLIINEFEGNPGESDGWEEYKEFEDVKKSDDWEEFEELDSNVLPSNDSTKLNILIEQYEKTPTHEIELEIAQLLEKNGESDKKSKLDIQSTRLANILGSIDKSKLVEVKYKYEQMFLSNVYYFPMKEQNIEQLTKLYQDSKPITKYFYVFAIVNKLDKVLEWLSSLNIIIPCEALNLAIEIGSKELVQWMLSKGTNWNIYSFSHAIITKDINFISWIKNSKCFWGLLIDSHKKIIQSNEYIREWLRANNCIWNI
jgi:hypothetical protein